jgi:hypothetical protein
MMTPADASFQRSVAASATYTTGSLQPPSGLSASCPTSLNTTDTATLTWTASPSTFTSGYTITYSGPSSNTVKVGKVTSTTISGLTKGTGYVFTLTATYAKWTSSSITSASVNCL